MSIKSALEGLRGQKRDRHLGVRQAPSWLPRRREFKWELRIRNFELVFRGLIMFQKIGENSSELCVLNPPKKCKN